MKVLFFAQAREAAGCGESDLEVATPITETEFWDLLTKKFPDLASLRKSARLARAERYLEAGELIQAADEVAIIPPVSGG